MPALLARDNVAADGAVASRDDAIDRDNRRSGIVGGEDGRRKEQDDSEKSHAAVDHEPILLHLVMAGLVPAISIRTGARCFVYRDHRDKPAIIEVPLSSHEEHVDCCGASRPRAQARATPPPRSVSSASARYALAPAPKTAQSNSASLLQYRRACRWRSGLDSSGRKALARGHSDHWRTVA